jgi:REP element-mobilizing transposase RayT
MKLNVISSLSIFSPLPKFASSKRPEVNLMKKAMRKNQQLTLTNFKRAGRPALHDPGIRHTERPIFTSPSSLHLTVKILRAKANLKNKMILSILKRSIMNARKMGLRVIHYSLEYDHVHLLIEAENNFILGKGMQAFGVTFSKALNRLRKIKGSVYKHRYHFRKIVGARQLKNVMNYIFSNGLKHKTSKSLINPFNSIRAEMKFKLFFKGAIELDLKLLNLLDRGKVFFRELEYL